LIKTDDWGIFPEKEIIMMITLAEKRRKQKKAEGG